MSWLRRRDEGNQRRLECAKAIYRVATSPDGTKYEVEATDAVAETAGAPIWLLPVLAGRAILRRLREQTWGITVREAGQAHRVVTTRFTGNRGAAEAMVAELAQIISTNGVDSLQR